MSPISTETNCNVSWSSYSSFPSHRPTRSALSSFSANASMISATSLSSAAFFTTNRSTVYVPLRLRSHLLHPAACHAIHLPRGNLFHRGKHPPKQSAQFRGTQGFRETTQEEERQRESQRLFSPPISSILPPTPPLPPTSLFPPILTTLPPRALPRKKVPPRLLREDPSWRETKKGGKRSTRKPAITGMKLPPLLREGGNSRGCEEWRHRGRKARVRYRDGVSAVGGKSWREWREFHRRVRHVPIPARKRGA